MKKNNKKSDVMEKYRVLRNIMNNYEKKEIKCISVTSNSNNEGKEIIAKNLAMSLAMCGKNTLYIDCSLSKSEKIKSFNIDNSKGLIYALDYIVKSKNQQLNEEIIINEISLESYIKETQYEYLSVVSLGEYNLDRYSLVFKTDYLKIILEILKRKFDYIIIDAPSFANLSYTQIVTGATDGCLFIIKGGVNEITECTKIKNKINTIGCKVLGCILNKEKKSTLIFDDRNENYIRDKYYDKGTKNSIEQSINVET